MPGGTCKFEVGGGLFLHKGGGGEVFHRPQFLTFSLLYEILTSVILHVNMVDMGIFILACLP